jgi:hypothetical protein
MNRHFRFLSQALTACSLLLVPRFDSGVQYSPSALQSLNLLGLCVSIRQSLVRCPVLTYDCASVRVKPTFCHFGVKPDFNLILNVD